MELCSILRALLVLATLGALVFPVNAATVLSVDLSLFPSSTETLLWSDKNSWRGSVVPEAGDTVIIDSTSVNCTNFFDIDVDTGALASLTIESRHSPPCLTRVFVGPGVVVNASQLEISTDASVSLLTASLVGNSLNVSGQLTGNGNIAFASTILSDGALISPGMYAHYNVPRCIAGWPGLWTWAANLTNTTFQTGALLYGDLVFGGTVVVEGNVNFFVKSMKTDASDFAGRVMVGNLTDVVLFDGVVITGTLTLDLMTDYQMNLTDSVIQWQRISVDPNASFAYNSYFGYLTPSLNCPPNRIGARGPPKYELDIAYCKLQKVDLNCPLSKPCQGPTCSTSGTNGADPVYCISPSSSGAGGLSMLLQTSSQQCSSTFGCNPACLNGGTCLSAIGACSCSINYTGNACQTLLFSATSSDTGNTGSGSSSGGASTSTSQLPATDAPVSLALIIGLAVGIPCAVLIGAGIAVLVYVLHKRDVTARTTIAMSQMKAKMVD